jgi:hypothetical protein
VFVHFSPDLDGYRARHVSRYVSRYVCVLVPICFTICLFISPDLDGNRGTRENVPRETHKGSRYVLSETDRAPKMFHDMFHDMFVH